MFKTIVIAIDGLDDGDRAFDLARTMASDAGARLVIVHVTELVGGKGGVYPWPPMTISSKHGSTGRSISGAPTASVPTR